jgi:hypothetical protein
MIMTRKELWAMIEYTEASLHETAADGIGTFDFSVNESGVFINGYNDRNETPMEATK